MSSINPGWRFAAWACLAASLIGAGCGQEPSRTETPANVSSDLNKLSAKENCARFRLENKRLLERNLDETGLKKKSKPSFPTR